MFFIYALTYSSCYLEMIKITNMNKSFWQKVCFHYNENKNSSQFWSYYKCPNVMSISMYKSQMWIFSHQNRLTSFLNKRKLSKGRFWAASVNVIDFIFHIHKDVHYRSWPLDGSAYVFHTSDCALFDLIRSFT